MDSSLSQIDKNSPLYAEALKVVAQVRPLTIGEIADQYEEAKAVAESRAGTKEHRAHSGKVLERLRERTKTDDPDLWFLFNTPTAAEVMRATRNDERAAFIVAELARFDVACAIWAKYNYPVFDLTLDFFKAAQATEFGDAGGDPIRTPFPSFVVRFPEPLGNDEARALFVRPNIAKVEGSTHVEFDFGQVEVSPLGAYAMWRNGTPLWRLFSGDTAKVSDSNPIDAGLEALAPVDYSALAQSKRVLGNLLLYLDHSGGLPTQKILGPDVPVERERTEKPQFRVGRPVKLGPEIRQALSHGSRTWKVDQRFVVRGHWRNQAHGPSHTLRRRTWIQPFWKGPQSITEAVQRVYEVQSGKSANEDQPQPLQPGQDTPK